ncbi:MAG: proprotein convertase P-domain-containing protein, partial [Planctomycetota bacterium]
TDVPKAIPDKGTTTSELVVDDTGPILDLDVRVKITHPWDSNMDVFLIAPDGTRVELFTDVGGMSDNFDDTTLDDEASQSITEGSAPFSGSFRPEGSLADFDGMDIGGTWTLEVTDDWEDDTGTLESWCLIATLEFKEPLPAPVIQTESKTPGGMHDTVTWNDVGETTEFSAAGVPVSIPDNGKRTSELDVRGIGMIEDLNVKLNISHSQASDLDVFLVAPDGTRVELFTDVGGSGDDFRDTTLDDEASVSIKDGSAPFSGSFKPEGKLANLRGKDIHGVWTLEVTDDSSSTSGTLNSWSLIADLADIFYCAECATDKNFNTVVADSGWIMDTSHRFTGLDPDRQYWYRVKARPMDAWLQTSQADFETDVLTNVETTADGDVVLASGGGGSGPEVHVIENPSFEDNGSWWIGSNNVVLLYLGTGFWSTDLWSYDGRWTAGVVFDPDFFFAKGDFAYFRQPDIDWTGVKTLVFDYCSYNGSELISKVIIGDEVVWSNTHTSGRGLHYDVTVDVSHINGLQGLKLQVEVDRSGWINAAIFWDNLRTYGPGGEPVGNIVSTPISIGADDMWDVLAFDGTTPAGTKLTADILPASGSNPIGSWRQMPSSNAAPSVIDINALTTKTIRLRANLETSNTANTPALHSWLLTCALAGRESDWSNVESSLQSP